jgi:hypothetical protein
MNDRKARGTAAARGRTRHPSRLVQDDVGERSTGNSQRGRNEPASARDSPPAGDGSSAGNSQLSDEIARDHEAQVNHLRDEPVLSSHFDDRHRETEKRDAGDE